MECEKIVNRIVEWLDNYAGSCGAKGFVVGISGGIDSALCSTLAAMTGRRVLCVSLPIHQAAAQVSRGDEHIAWLQSKFDNVESAVADLTGPYEALLKVLPTTDNIAQQQLTEANTRSRMRMSVLYYYAGLSGLLVVGTGNKIEDFGVGFYTKYGDGGVDISPIADLTKSEVFALSAHLGVCSSILQAKPTDGLFGDDRSDEDQIGASYPELERAMAAWEQGATAEQFEGREREVFEIFLRRNRANRHKMEPIPICSIPSEWK